MTAAPGDIPRLRSDLWASTHAVWEEIVRGYLAKQLYTEFRDEATARHPEADHTFLNSYSQNYVAAQIMRIRRLADKSQDRQESLWWIIQRIRKNRALASRSALLDAVRKRRSTHRVRSPDGPTADVDEWWIGDANRFFTDNYGDGDLPSDDALAALQGQLRSDLASVIAYADRELAHSDPRGPIQKVTYADVHQALDDVAEVANAVELLLTFSPTVYEPVIIQGDWQRVFRSGLFQRDIEQWEFPDQPGYT